MGRAWQRPDGRRNRYYCMVFFGVGIGIGIGIDFRLLMPADYTRLFDPDSDPDPDTDELEIRASAWHEAVGPISKWDPTHTSIISSSLALRTESILAMKSSVTF